MGPVLIQDTANNPAHGGGEDITRSCEYGGRGGGLFDDSEHFVKNHARITQIAVRSGTLVDAIHITYSDGNTVQHGGSGGGLHTIILEDDEKITSVSGRYGPTVDQINFHTSSDRTFGPYGGAGGRPFNVDFGADRQLLYFFGHCGLLIDSIGFAYGPDALVGDGVVYKGDAYGADGGVEFDNKTTDAKITAVHIRHGRRIDAIQMQYNGEWAERRGGGGGAPVTVYIPGDHLSKITGTYDTTLRSIRLHTHGGWTSREYGENAGTPFTIYKEGCIISGIHGKYGEMVEKLGGYLQVFSE